MRNCAIDLYTAEREYLVKCREIQQSFEVDKDVS